MTDEHQSAEVFPHVWHVNRCQYVEVEEDVDSIADGDEYDHCKYLLGRLLTTIVMHTMCIIVTHYVMDLVSVKTVYKDLEHQRILSGDITWVTMKGLRGKTQDKKVDMRENITNLDVDVG